MDHTYLIALEGGREYARNDAGMLLEFNSRIKALKYAVNHLSMENWYIVEC